MNKLDFNCFHSSAVKLRTMEFTLAYVFCFVLSYAVHVKTASFVHLDSDFRVDPEDCSKFHIFRNGEEFVFKCPDDFVVNTVTRACVPKGSSKDTCKFL